VNKSIARMALMGAFALAGSCADEGTEVRIDVEPAPALAAVSHALNIRVLRDPYGTRTIAHPWEAHPWKKGRFTISLTPRDDESESFAVEVEALGYGSPTPIGWARVITEFVDGKRRYLTLAIDQACPPSVICGAHETCRAGLCETADFDPAQLGTDSVNAPSTDMLASRDAGVPPSDGSTTPSPGPSDASSNLPVVDAYVGPIPVVPGGRDAAIPDWGARIAEAGVLVRDAGRSDGAGITASRCFTREVLESEEELEAGDVTRMHNAVGFCFANNTASCVDLLTIATRCTLPSPNPLLSFTNYLLFWNSTSGVATAQASLDGDAGTRQLGTATPLSYGRYRIATTFPWSVSLPGEAGGTLGSSATCEIELYPDATSLADSTGEVTVCIP
jgi:hypothetical protein